MTPLKIGTRGSELALWQAREVARLLGLHDIPTEIVKIQTTGDRRTDVPLAEVGGKGMFVKELEDALRQRTVDFAVHSLKDVPSILPEGFRLVAFLERADPRDAWFQRDGTAIADLPDGAVVGTGSPRRAAQLESRFPGFDVRNLRGNVPTRLEKMKRGDYDGIVLAAAGVTRLGRANEITSLFGVDEMIPAAGQGIVAMEIVEGRDDVAEALAKIDHAPSALAARTERGVLEEFGTSLDCYSAIAVHASRDGDALTIRAFLADDGATRSIRETISGPVAEAASLARRLADAMKAKGAMDLLGVG